jgi:acetolactate synthase regulatory subunit
MTRIALRVVLVATLLWAAAPAPVRADGTGVTSDGGREPVTVVSGLPSWRSWSVGDEVQGTSISQLYVPFVLNMPLGDRLDLLAHAAYARTTARREWTYADNFESTLSGLVDGRVKVAYRPGPRLMLAAGVGLPFGDGALDSPEEIDVAQMLWSPLLDLRAKSAGQGLTVEGSAAYAVPLSPTVTVGLGAGAVLAAEYDLYTRDDFVTTHRPGTELSASIGIDVRPRPTTLLRLDVAGRRFGDDEVNGDAAFRAASRLEVDMTIASARPVGLLALRVRGVFRGDDHRYTPAGDEVRERVSVAEAYYLTAEAYRTLSETVSAGVELDGATVSRSEDFLGDGERMGAGPGLRIGRAGGTRAQLRVIHFRTYGDAWDAPGWDVSGGVSLAF